jgi:hypothetical protein
MFKNNVQICRVRHVKMMCDESLLSLRHLVVNVVRIKAQGENKIPSHLTGIKFPREFCLSLRVIAMATLSSGSSRVKVRFIEKSMPKEKLKLDTVPKLFSEHSSVGKGLRSYGAFIQMRVSHHFPHFR